MDGGQEVLGISSALTLIHGFTGWVNVQPANLSPHTRSINFPDYFQNKESVIFQTGLTLPFLELPATESQPLAHNTERV